MSNFNSKCTLCGKPTNSHKIGNRWVCHTCYEGADEEKIEELEEEANERRKEKVENILKIITEMKRQQQIREKHKDMDCPKCGGQLIPLSPTDLACEFCLETFTQEELNEEGDVDE